MRGPCARFIGCRPWDGQRTGKGKGCLREDAEGGTNITVKGERGFAETPGTAWRLGLSKGTGRGASAEGGIEAASTRPGLELVAGDFVLMVFLPSLSWDT